MARYQVMTWRGIPSVVKAQDSSGGRAKRELPVWFAQEIDRIAMREGLAGSDAYTEAFTWSSPEERPGTAAEVVEAVARELAAQWGQPLDE